MKKYIEISVLSIFSLVMYGAENSLLHTKAVKRTSGSRSLAASDGAVTKAVAEPRGENLSRSQPIAIPKEKCDDFSPSMYYMGFGALLEKKNSYTPGNDSGR